MRESFYKKLKITRPQIGQKCACRVFCRALFCCFFICFLSGTAFSGRALAATTQEKLEEAKDKAARTESAITQNEQAIQNISGKKSALEGKLSDLNDALGTVAAQLNELDGRISEKESDIREAAAQLESATQQLETAQAELEDTRQRLSDTQKELEKITKDLEQTKTDLAKAEAVRSDQYASMKMQVKFLYEKGNNYYLEILFDSASFADFLNRRSYIRQLSAYDAKKLEEYRKAAEEISKRQAELEEKQQEAAKKKAEIERQEEDIEARGQAIRARQAEIAQKKEKLTSEQTQLLDLQSDQKAKQDEVSGLVSQTAQSIQGAGEELADAESNADALEKELEKQNSEIAALQKKLEEEKRLQEVSDKSTWTDIASVTVADNDRYLLANLIYCEAGNQPYDGQVGVGAVVMNRVRSGAFPNTISGVIYQSGQFSPAASGRLATALAQNKATDSCYRAADAAMAGQTTVGNCLFFRTPVSGVTAKYRIGGHIFY